MLTFNADISGSPARRDTYRGRDFLVVPITLVREKVLGGNGGEFLPAEEIKPTAELDLWESMPLSLGHPSERGMKVSARRKDMSEALQVGHVFNVQYEPREKSLKGEAWLDIQALQEKERDDILADVEAGVPREVSTGYVRDVVFNTGRHDGVTYATIGRNLVPDHVAILERTQEGKCSIEDGCGLAVNEDGEYVAVNIEDMDPGLVQRGLRAFLEAVGITRGESTEGRDGPAENSNTGENSMDRAQLIQAIVAATALTENSLENVEDEALEAMHADLEAGEDPDQDPAGQGSGDSGGESGRQENRDRAEVTRESVQNALGISDRTLKFLQETDPDTLERAVAEASEEKERLVENLADREEVDLEEAELRGLQLNVLRSLEKSTRPADYSGQGGPRGRAEASAGEGDVPEPPRVFSGEKEAVAS